MRIAIVSQWYPPDYSGAAFCDACAARAFTEPGRRVTVVTVRGAREQPAVEAESNIRTVRLDR